jgi:hypothetical protein
MGNKQETRPSKGGEYSCRVSTSSIIIRTRLVLGEKELWRGVEVVGRRGLGVGFCGAATDTTPKKRGRREEEEGSFPHWL